MEKVVIFFNFLAAVSSFGAAYFWYRASQVEEPPEFLHGGAGLPSPTDPSGLNAFVNAGPLVKFARDNGQRNKVAAFWSGAAALFMFASTALGPFVK